MEGGKSLIPWRRLKIWIVLSVLSGAIAVGVYVWWLGGLNQRSSFTAIYRASLRQALGNTELLRVVGEPVRFDESISEHHYEQHGGRLRVRFVIPIEGPVGVAIIKGEAVKFGKNWLLVELVASIPGAQKKLELLPQTRV